MQKKFTADRTYLYLAVIMIAAFAARLWHINTQSLWLDELHTMNESDPTWSWSGFFDFLKYHDVHPPLHYMVVRFCFTVFGQKAFVARVISAIAGVAGIWAIFELGKELYNKSVGLIAAALVAVNYYHLYFSQEARDYTFLFLFTTCSFLYLARLVKNLKVKDAVGYGLTTLLLLYTHYFGFMAVCSQVAIAFTLFCLDEKQVKLVYIKRFLVSGLIVVAGYSVWIPAMKVAGNITSTWLPQVKDTFLSDYFFEYFGNAELLKPLLIIFLVVFALRSWSEEPQKGSLQKNPIAFSFFILSAWILISNLVPYVRSILVLPTLYPRYSIIVLPAYIVIIAFAISTIKNVTLRSMTLIVFVGLSWLDITILKDYYTKPTKAQFREVVAYLAKNNPDDLPVIDEVTAWHQEYYFKLNKIKPKILNGTKADNVDAILRPGNPLYHLKAFWIVGAHHEEKIDQGRANALDSFYYKVSNAQYIDAWAQLYVLKSDSLNTRFISYDKFTSGGEADTVKHVKPIWSGSVTSEPIIMEKGKYRIIVCANGTPAKFVYPNLAVSINGKELGSFYTTPEKTIGTFDVTVPGKQEVRFKVALTNDFSTNTEDRNAFLHFVMIRRIGD